MQTQASWQAVQRATPASSRRTFWNILKGSAVTLIIGVTLSPPPLPIHFGHFLLLICLMVEGKLFFVLPQLPIRRVLYWSLREDLEGGCQTSKVKWEDIWSIKQELMESGENIWSSKQSEQCSMAVAEKVRAKRLENLKTVIVKTCLILKNRK